MVPHRQRASLPLANLHEWVGEGLCDIQAYCNRYFKWQWDSIWEKVTDTSQRIHQGERRGEDFTLSHCLSLSRRMMTSLGNIWWPSSLNDRFRPSNVTFMMYLKMRKLSYKYQASSLHVHFFLLNQGASLIVPFIKMSTRPAPSTCKHLYIYDTWMTCKYLVLINCNTWLPIIALIVVIAVLFLSLILWQCSSWYFNANSATLCFNTMALMCFFYFVILWQESVNTTLT